MTTCRIMNGGKMPIFEFKCSKCEGFFELLVMNKGEETEMKCPACGSENFERVISTTSHVMADGTSGKSNGPGVQKRKCASGECTTYDIPGHTR